MITPLGRPVVPEVKSTSLGVRGPHGVAARRRHRRRHLVAAARERVARLDDDAVGALRCARVAVEQHDAAQVGEGRAGVAQHADGVRAEEAGRRDEHRPPRAASTYAASAPFQRVFTGTIAAPAECAPSALTIQPRLFGAQIATRSPASTPAAIIARAETSAFSPSSR